MNRKLIRKLIHGIELNQWIAISYYDEIQKEVVPFLVGIDSIDNVFMQCTRIQLTTNTLTKGGIKVSSILSVMAIDGTYYDTSEAHKQLVQSNLFNYSSDYSIDTLFDYYFRCSKEEIPYSLKTTPLYERLAYASNLFKERIELDNKLYNDILQLLLETSNNKSGTDIKFAYNIFGIKTEDGSFYPIIYKEMCLDIAAKTIAVVDEIRFNFKFFDGKTNRSFDISDYINADINEFLTDININLFKYIDTIKKNLNYGDKIDETGVVLYFERNYSKNIFINYERIKVAINYGLEPMPIKAFLGCNKYKHIDQKKQIVTFYNDLNIEQLSMIQKSTKHYMTYVQAPPGSKKNNAIISTLLTSLINNDKVLLTGKNDGSLIEIYDFFTNYKYEKNQIYFPILILSDKERTLDYVKFLSKQFHKTIMKLSYKEVSLNESLDIHKYTTKIDEIISKLDNTEMIDDIIRGINNNNQSSSRMKSLHKSLLRNRLDTNRTHLSKPRMNNDNLPSVLYNTCLKKIKTLFSSRYYPIRKVFLRNYEQEKLSDNTWYEQILELFDDPNNLNLLTEVFPIILTSNEFLKNINVTTGAFDLAIVNDASQCSVTDGIFALIKAKRALVIGDLLDSKPLTSIDPIADSKLKRTLKIDKKYQYTKNSILSILEHTDKVSDRILLKDHYGGRGRIVDFTNKKYYDGKLCIQKREFTEEHPLILIDTQRSEEAHGNTCIIEAKKVIELIRASNYSPGTIGVLTPFATQKRLIQSMLQENNIRGVECFTLSDYRYQRKNLMIVSLAITLGTREKTLIWISKDSRLSYYATTGALEQLIIVCNKDRVKHSLSEDSDLLELLRYTHYDGDTELNSSLSEFNRNIIDGIRDYNYESEEKMQKLLKTIKTSKKLKTKIITKDSMHDFFDLQNKEFKYYFKLDDLDYVITDNLGNILCIVELSGIRQSKLSRNTLYKIRFCEKEGYTFISLPAVYSRRYQYVLELIKDCL